MQEQADLDIFLSMNVKEPSLQNHDAYEVLKLNQPLKPYKFTFGKGDDAYLQTKKYRTSMFVLILTSKPVKVRI